MFACRRTLPALLLIMLAISATTRCNSVAQAATGLAPEHQPVESSQVAGNATMPFLDDVFDVVPLVLDDSSVSSSTTAPAETPPSAPSANPFREVQSPAAPTYPVRPAAVDSQPAGPVVQSQAFSAVDQQGAELPPGGVEPNLSPIPLPPPESPLGRSRIIFRTPVIGVDGHGQAMLRPNVQLADASEVTDSLPSMGFDQLPEVERLPPPSGYAPEMEYEVPAEQEWTPCPDEPVPYDHIGPWREAWYRLRAHLNGPRAVPSGVGPEFVMHAPFWIDTTQPLNHCRIRGDGAFDWEFPDRAEYFWAKTPPTVQGPGFDDDGGEPSLDYQEASFYIERGTKRFSVGTELPIIAVDPDVRLNTAGFADMSLISKAVLLDGKCWQITQLFRTHFPTGSKTRGTGNGHFSLEPGVAWRYKWSDVTYFHGDLKYWFPIAADLEHSGQLFDYGIGISHVWIDADDWALIPTLELKAWTILDGRQTRPFQPDTTDFDEIDTIGILNVHPGLRWVCDKGCDCGTKEFGISSGFSVTDDHWYRGILRLEFRWTR